MNLGNAQRLARLRGSDRPPPQSLWKASWKEIGGKRFFVRSKWEGQYAAYLEFLKQRGQIRDWHYEKKTFWFDRIKRGVRSYKPDFRVDELNGESTWHEVKGWNDPRSLTKLKRMRIYYPDIKIILIDKVQHAKIAQFSKLIPQWE